MMLTFILLLLCGKALAQEYYDDDNHEVSISDVKGKKVGSVEALAYTAGQDYFYALMGHPRSKLANKLHMKSWAAVSRLMNAYQISNKASIYNNDVGEPLPTEFSQADPVEHDHQSYFGSQEWLLDYGQNQLGVNFQQSAIEVDKFFPKTGVQGNLWQDCLNSAVYDESVCIRMVQLRNIRKFIGENATVDHLDDAILWIGEVLEQQGHYPTLIVFQEFSEGISEILRKLKKFVFQKVSGATEGYNVLGVAFTMMNKNISSTDVSLCNAVHHVPVLNMGQLPLESYFLLQFNPFEHLGTSRLYRVDVVNQNSTALQTVDFLSQRCI